MSLEAITWAYKTQVGSPTRKAVLLVLANYADADDASSYPGRSRIEKMTELKTTAVKDALRDLSEMGVIQVEPRLRQDGSSSSNRYVINMGWSSNDPSPPATDDPSRSSDDPRTDTKNNRQRGTANTKPAARVKKGFGPQPDEQPDAERTGSLPDDGEQEAPPRKTPRNTVDLAKDFERSARLHYPKGDSRRVTNLTALRANIARWRDQDGIPVSEIGLAMDTFWAGADGYVKVDGEPWRRFINLFARVHAKATAPDITDPAYYSDQQQEDIVYDSEQYLEQMRKQLGVAE